MIFGLLTTLLLSVRLTYAASLPIAHHDHPHRVDKRLPRTWYQPDDHHVHSLFKRAPGDGEDFAPVGSPTWSSSFPSSSPDPSKLPAAWVDALNAAVAAGKIPNIPRSTNTPGSNPVYPAGNNPNSPEVCSATYKCRNPGDTWDAPTGYFAASFDDGPLPPTTKLVQFFQGNNETTTHFMIGVNILQYPQQFQAAFNTGGDIAVHTWTHPYMTTLDNLGLLGQFGWTMELIRNSTGGRVPRFWRPPYGDSDNRVRAVAKEVFGLETVIWNQDTEDWSLTTGGTTAAKVHASMQQWLSGPKSPGLIILEHEISDQSVQAFIDAYPLIKSNGWMIASLTEIVNRGSTYQNAESSTSGVVPAGILAGHNLAPNSSSPSSSQTSSQSLTATINGLASSSTPTAGSNSAVIQSHLDMLWTVLTIFGAVVANAAFT